MSPQDMRNLAWRHEFDRLDDMAGVRRHGRGRAHRVAMSRSGARQLAAAPTMGLRETHGSCELPPLPLTRHAAHRLKNRGITQEQLLLVTEFGRAQRMHGATRYALDKRSRQLVEQTLPPEQLRRLKTLDILAVIADDGSVITAAHRTQRLRRDTKH